MTEVKNKAASKSEWVKSAVRTATLPSGTLVEFELPDIPDLVKGGTLPNELTKIATDAVAGKAFVDPDSDEIPEGLVDDVIHFQRFLVAAMVHSPKIVIEDVPKLPADDREMLLAFAFRQRDMDAVGHHISGLEKLSSFRRFRDLDSSPADFLD